MKLKIKNYKNIIGNYGLYRISDAVEEPDYYIFTVTNDSMKTHQVFLRRDGRIDQDGDTVFHFGRNTNSQMVTAKWFENITNAANTIITEYEM